ncbi:MAG: GNAT family N-acetyltransferase, partial [Flavobacteriaceae bacterium]
DMLKERFQQKREANYELPLMNFYRKVFYQLLLDKKASLYVIYDRGRAISISMNLILGNTLMLFNSSYDKHYAPFGLGHINMIKNIDWAFEQGFETIDLGRGDYTHKRRWVNKTYTYLEVKFGFDGYILKKLKALIGILFLKIRYLLIQVLKFFRFQHLYAFIRKQSYNRGSSEERRSNETSLQTKLLPANDVDRRNLVPLDLFKPAYSNELAVFLTVLHKQRLSHFELKPYMLENKPGILYVEKEGRLFRLNQDSEREQKTKNGFDSSM